MAAVKALTEDPPEWAEDEARRILARAYIRARQEGRTTWEAAKIEIAARLVERGLEGR